MNYNYIRDQILNTLPASIVKSYLIQCASELESEITDLQILNIYKKALEYPNTGLTAKQLLSLGDQAFVKSREHSGSTLEAVCFCVGYIAYISAYLGFNDKDHLKYAVFYVSRMIAHMIVVTGNSFEHYYDKLTNLLDNLTDLEKEIYNLK